MACLHFSSMSSECHLYLGHLANTRFLISCIGVNRTGYDSKLCFASNEIVRTTKGELARYIITLFGVNKEIIDQSGIWTYDLWVNVPALCQLKLVNISLKIKWY